eukprot:gene942-1185_t
MCSAASAESKEFVRPIDLYSYAICPFCERTKAVLDYLGIPYRSIEVNPLTKSEIAFSTDYKKVPIARVPGNSNGEEEIINGSDKMIDYIRSQVLSEKQQRNLITADTEHWLDWSEKKL